MKPPILGALGDGLNMEATAVVCADKAVKTSGLTDRVPWWSFTKTVLAIAILRLVEDGLLELDDKLPARRSTLASFSAMKQAYLIMGEQRDTTPMWQLGDGPGRSIAFYRR